MRQRRNKVSTAATLPASKAKAPGSALYRRDGRRFVRSEAAGASQPSSEVAPIRELAPRDDGMAWHARAVALWGEIWRSPMAEGGQYLEVDVEGMIMLLDLIHHYWMLPLAMRPTNLAGEIARQRQAFGLTPIDRRRLQWEIDRGRRSPRDHAVAPTQHSEDAVPSTAKAARDPRRNLELLA